MNIVVPNNIEENFEESKGTQFRYAFRTLQQYDVYFVCCWAAWTLLIFALGMHRNGWRLPKGIPLDLTLTFGLVALVFSLFTMPRTLLISVDTKMLSYRYGYRPFAIQRVLRFDEIDGLTVHIGYSSYYGRKARLSIKWRSYRPNLEFGVYPTNDVALERAEYISVRTSIPFIKADKS